MMSSSPDNPSPIRLPGGLEEADLLALVEGEALPRERAPAVQRALAADAGLTRLVEGMRRDRTVLRAMGGEKAPAGLIESVRQALEPVLERRMLLGISDGEPLEGHLPVSRVVPQRAGVLAKIGPRRLALAAGLLLVATGGMFTAATLMSAGGGKSRIEPLARGDSANRSGLAEDRALKIAAAPAVAKAHEEDVAAPAATAAAAAPVTIADAEPVDGPPVPGPMDAAEAARLLGERRLVMRVVVPDGRIDRVTERLSRPQARAGWQLAGAAPAALASALGPDVPPTVLARTPQPPAMAGDQVPGTEWGPPIPATAPAPGGPEWTPVPSVYVLNTRMDVATLEGVRGALRDLGAEVVFEETETPLPLEKEPITNPAAVLWWGQGPGGWSAWGAVPVVIGR